MKTLSKNIVRKAALSLSASFLALATFASVASAEIIIDEARFGAALTQPEWLPGNNNEEDQVMVTAEVLFAPVNIDIFGLAEGETSGFAYQLVNPRPHIGAGINTDSDGTSTVYTGFTWHFPVGEIVFIEGTFGFGLNNGETEFKAGSNRADLGSHILFRESIALGFNLTDTTTFLVQAAHQSHAGIFGDDNHGLTNFGAKVGFKF